MEISNCLSREFFVGLGAGSFESAFDVASADAHLAGCTTCRAKLRSQFIAKGSKRTPINNLFDDADAGACLGDDECVRFVRGKMDSAEREGADLHIADCSTCRGIVRDLMEFEQELTRDAFNPVAETLSRLQTVGARLKDAGTSWLQHLSDRVSATRQSLRPVAASFAFSSGSNDTRREKLDFGDESEFSGSYEGKSGACQLHIEHVSCLPGTLALLEAADSTHKVVWRRFIVFRRGMRRSVVDVKATSDLELTFLTIGTVVAAELPDEVGALLIDSFGAVEEDVPSVSAWRVWAESAPKSSLAPAISMALNSILGRSSQ